MIKFINTLILTFLISFSFSQSIVRGPYLQTPTSSSIIVMWRTDVPSSSSVYYGTSLNQLNQSVSNSANVSNHVVEITGLQPYTKYYYFIGTPQNILAGADSNHYFITSILPYTEQEIRIWATGDFGKGNQGQIDTKQSFVNFTRNEQKDPDIWIWLGDNAYQDGKDSEYQSNVFGLNGYSDIFNWLPFWPSPGNHDYNTVWSQNGILGIPYTLNSISDHDGPYFDIVDVPEYAEAGGYESTHEVFYSYDYGNVHMLSLNSEVYAIGNNNVLNQMLDWIHDDLSQNDKDWTIAYWHQPPYSKGSHDSDDFYEDVMKDMREKVLPVLEQYDIDMVICGHSHVYERSYLMHGHYGYSNSLVPTMIMDYSSGEFAAGTPYVKNTFDTNPQGTVYAVVGNSGSSHGNIGSNHPAMYTSASGSGIYGSFVVDIYKNKLRARFLATNGQFLDDFTIVKQNQTIHLGNDTAICLNDSMVLSPNLYKGSDSLAYLWTPTNETTSSITISPNSTTNYIVKVTDLVSGQISRDTITIDVLPIPTNIDIDENQQVLSTTNGYTYAWYRDGNLLTANSASISPTTEGMYQVIATNQFGCSVASEYHPFFNYIVDVNVSQNEICEGDSVIVFFSESGGSDSTFYTWINFTPPSNNFYYEANQTTSFYVQGIDFIDNDTINDTATVQVIPTPIQPIIQEINGELVITNYDPNYLYDWTINGQAYITSNAASVPIQQNGLYAVVAEYQTCFSEKSELLVNANSIKDIINTQNIIIPNPNDGSFSVQLNNGQNIKNLKIFNELGQLVLEKNDGFTSISIQNAVKGTYIVLVENTDGKHYQQMMVIQ